MLQTLGPKDWVRAGWVAGVVLVAGLWVSWQLQQSVLEEARQASAVKFKGNVERIHRAIHDRMQAHEQILRGAVSLFEVVGTPSRAHWAAYVAGLSLVEGYPGIQGVGYAAVVRSEQRAQFIKDMRVSGVPDYDIRPSSTAPLQVPVTYLEPSNDRNRRALGFDMWSEPARHAAMQQAGESGRAAITTKVRLASESSQVSACGFLMYVPVYRQGARLDTPASRTDNLIGFVNSPIRVDDVIKGTLGNNPDEVLLRIYDGAAATASALMYVEGGSKSLCAPAPAGAAAAAASDPGDSPAATSAALATTTQLKFSNHAWTLAYSAPQSLSDEDRIQANRMLVTGVLASLLLAGATYFLVARLRGLRRNQAHYYRLANHDNLTGLPNRSMFQDRLERAIVQAERSGNGMALAFIDADLFKDVNDRLGHTAGDALLVEIADRLSASLRKADSLARLGGDEFTAILNNLHSAEDARVAARHIFERMTQPFVLGGKLHDISVSVGIAQYPGDGRTASELMDAADRAMYAAKRAGGNRFMLYDASMQAEPEHPQKWVTSVKAELESAAAKAGTKASQAPRVDPPGNA